MNKVAMIGVDAAGMGFLHYVKNKKLLDLPSFVVHTNHEDLQKSKIERNILLPKSPTSLENNEELQTIFREFETIIFVSSLSEDTNKNILVPLMELSKSCGNHIVHLTTIPFSWESKKTQTSSSEKAQTLDKICDVSAYFDNSEIPKYIKSLGITLSLSEAFETLDKIMIIMIQKIVALDTFDKSMIRSFLQKSMYTLEKPVS